MFSLQEMLMFVKIQHGHNGLYPFVRDSISYSQWEVTVSNLGEFAPSNCTGILEISNVRVIYGDTINYCKPLCESFGTHSCGRS